MGESKQIKHKNIFVTQLNSEIPEYAMIPVVKEASDKLLLAGRNTLQHTLLLKKELEAEQVDAQLAAKKAEFQQKIATCMDKHHEIAVKQQALREKTKNASNLIEEQNLKQRRALRRCENDAQERLRLEGDLARLGQIADAEIAKRRHLKQKITKYKKSADFLTSVVNALPQDYMIAHDDPIKGLMERHSYLVSTKEDLVAYTEGLSDELKQTRREINEAEAKHGYNLLELNGKLENFRSHYENLKSKNSTLEAEAEYALAAYKNRIQYAGDALRAVDSLVERCGGAAYVSSKSQEVIEEKTSFEKNQGKHLKKSGLDMLLNGISFVTQTQTEVVGEAKRQSRGREITFAKGH